MTVILDSSAMIAYLAGEPEGEAVRALFGLASDESERLEIYAHAINLAEVFYHVLATQTTETAEEAITILKEAGTVERSDIDGPFWREMSRLITTARQLPRASGGHENLALGDAFGVALANRLGGDFVTKDRTEIEPLERAGLVSAQFIR